MFSPRSLDSDDASKSTKSCFVSTLSEALFSSQQRSSHYSRLGPGDKWCDSIVSDGGYIFSQDQEGNIVPLTLLRAVCVCVQVSSFDSTTSIF